MPKSRKKTGKRNKRRHHHEIPKEKVFDPANAYDQCINHLEQLYHEACSVSPAKAADVFQVIYGFVKMVRNNHKQYSEQGNFVGRSIPGKQFKITIPEKPAHSTVSTKKIGETVASNAQNNFHSQATPKVPLLENEQINEEVVNVLREAISRINRPCSRTFERFANQRRQVTIDSLVHNLEEMEMHISPYDAGLVIAHYDVDNQGFLNLKKFTNFYNNNLAAATLSNPGDFSVQHKETDILVTSTSDAEILLLKQIERVLTKEPVPLTQTYMKICGMMGESRITPAVLHEVLRGNYGFTTDPVILEKVIARYDKTTWGLSKSEFVRMLSHAKLA